ncbi:MAG TPA: sigma-54-dependent Fis family transcriptional regulator, partial [Candidatus Avidesulfovibrio excrementigallinarum]|nr:sigma-54-dependent Fis family transcriptional regulator [Candidatus Avidesulfovibrio excrementigallinarum]
LCGESGTGKEVFAQAIHNASERADKPFVAINCGALPHDLVQSILFGYEPSSFTGASKYGQAGQFEIASGGTLFLDEIGEMPLDIQVSLLRVLQDRKVTRLGGHMPRSVDVRIIAATNRDLRQEVRLGNFREDLFYRLNVVSITLPPLRERMDDFSLLIDFILSQRRLEPAISSSSFSDKAMQLMRAYRWPGNIRQLGNFLERLCIISNNNIVTDEDVCSLLEIQSDIIDTSSDDEGLLRRKIEEYSGNIKRIAQDLGCSRSTLYYKMHKYNIDLHEIRREAASSKLR